jgi:hypothetical protein
MSVTETIDITYNTGINENIMNVTIIEEIVDNWSIPK